jgi:sigma-B regulation protein RsbU (phosphoserine phosphatase)
MGALLGDSPGEAMSRDGTAVEISEDVETSENSVLERGLERAAFMQDVSRQLAGSLNVRRTLLHLLHLGVPYLGDWMMVVMFAGRGATLVSVGPAGPVSDPVFLPELDRSASALDRLRLGGQIEFLQAPAGDDLGALVPEEGMRANAAELGPAHVLGVGLTARGRTIGALVLVRTAHRGFDPADRTLVEEFARRAAVTLDAAALYEERNEVASVLQASLRPPILTELPGMRVSARFRAAMEHMSIGGDFYDLHGADDDWSLVIGDVCGKGVDAAVLTGRARQTIRTAAHFDRSPAKILTALNDVLYSADSDRFVTVACARVRPARADGCAEVTLALAGHPAPLVLRRDGVVEEPVLSGTLSGVLPDLSYAEVTIRLRPGDLMLFYTDGVCEAKGQDEMFGVQRLRALLPAYAGAEPETVCAAVEQRVIDHLDGGSHDDIALLALRCEGESR